MIPNNIPELQVAIGASLLDPASILGATKPALPATRIKRYYHYWRFMRPARRYFIVAGFLLGLVVLSALAYGDLWAYTNTPLFFTVHKQRYPQHTVELPLALDAGGISFIVAGLLTPVFLSLQVERMPRVAESSVQNSSWRIISSQIWQEYTSLIKETNKSFERVGSRRSSKILLVASFGMTIFMYFQIARFGPLAAWNPTHSSASKWRVAVYHGWWARPSARPVSCVILTFIGTYYVYFLLKQLWMGAIYAQFARKSTALVMSAVPTPAYDIDGYSGLRNLRLLLQATYFCTVVDFLSVLGMIFVWLPFSEWSFFVAIAITIISIATVVYPSVQAHASIGMVKREYAALLIQSTHGAGPLPSTSGNPPQLPEAAALRLSQLWQASNLPFRTRSGIAAASIYFIAPLTLAIISALALPK